MVKVSSICKKCKNQFVPKHGSKGIFCGSSCSAKYNNAGRTRTIKSRIKTSQSMQLLYTDDKQFSTCIICQNYTLKSNKTCSFECTETFNQTEASKEIQIKKCKICENNIFGNQKTCSKLCWYISHPKSILVVDLIFCSYCGKHTQKGKQTCSKTCQDKLSSKRQHEYLKNPENRRKYRGNKGKSYLEESFEKWLLDNGFNNSIYGFLMEIHFQNPTSKKHGWIDFLFPKHKLVIELDGTHHKKRKHLDDIRDDYLRNKGYTVVRITHDEYTSGKRIEEIKILLGIK